MAQICFGIIGNLSVNRFIRRKEINQLEYFAIKLFNLHPDCTIFCFGDNWYGYTPSVNEKLVIVDINTLKSEPEQALLDYAMTNSVSGVSILDMSCIPNYLHVTNFIGYTNSTVSAKYTDCTAYILQDQAATIATLKNELTFLKTQQLTQQSKQSELEALIVTKEKQNTTKIESLQELTNKLANENKDLLNTMMEFNSITNQPKRPIIAKPIESPRIKPTFSTYYWKDRKNVGDYYGYWLLNKLFGDKYNFVWGDSNVDIISTGSILTSPVVGPSTFVAGCGKHGFKDNEQFHGILENVISVRGQLSEKFLGGTDLLLGDPGTYISALYNKSVEVTHAYGLICHWKDIKFFKEKYGDKLFIIDTGTTDVCKFIDQIRSCSFIFSSSLHGLIFAHSYGIPAVHVKHLCTESKDDFKFKDYYSTLGINYMNIQYSDSFSFSNYYNSVSDITNYCPTKKRIQKIQNDLKLCYDIVDAKLSARAGIRQNKTMAKICLCGIAKCENSYIREWVEHYKNLGFDKIYLYDNNDTDGERFEEVIGDYVQSGYVKILDVRGLTNQQIVRYNEFYHSYANNYDWVAFFDIDEFLNIGNSSNIHEFIAQQKYDAFDAIAINWKYFDDNDLVHYSSAPVTQRFTREYKEKNFAHSQYKFSKRIIRTNLDLVVNSSHGPLAKASNLEYSSDKTNKLLVCNVAGEKIKNTHFFNNWSHDGGYLAHYRFKSIEEYIINKMKRGYPTLYKNSGKDLCIDDFFELNMPTKEKLDCAARLLGLPVEQLYIKYKIRSDEDNNTYLYF